MLRNGFPLRGLAVLAGLVSTSAAFAGLGPENVVLVVNGESSDSLRVASAYVNLRKIPAGNVVVLNGLSGKEFIDVEGFRKQILSPVLSAIEARGLNKQIDCITYSVDIPYSINVSGDVKGQKLPQVITQTASTNGLTYLMDWTAKGDADYLRLDINTYCRRRLPIPVGVELTTAEQNAYGEAMAKYAEKQYKSAIAELEKLLTVDRTDPSMLYNLACCYALDGQKDAAVETLRKAVNMGWRNYGQTVADSDFNSIKDREDFSRVVRLMQTLAVRVQSPVAFRRDTGWNRAGERDANGAKYMLSTFLGVTAGRGNSVEEIIESLRRAKAADYSSPKGTIYFERNGDVRSKTREWGFQPAADELAKLGIKAIVEDGVLPKERSDVAGGVIGIADFDWAGSKSTILPGAIVEHLTSCGGMINQGAGQTPCTEFIKFGAAGSSGAVTEPFALQEKFPTPFIHVHYAKGFTLAESFYMSVFGPYQLLIIGDPMCRPWAKRAEVTVTGITSGQSLISPVSIKPTLSAETKISVYKMYVDGKFVVSANSGLPLKLDPKQFEEGYHELSIVAERADETAGQYRLAMPFVVPGAKHVFETPEKIQPATNGSVQVKLSAKGATKIELFHFGRMVGSCGPSGTIEIKSGILGLGNSTLYPVASFGSVKVFGKPISVVSN